MTILFVMPILRNTNTTFDFDLIGLYTRSWRPSPRPHTVWQT